MPVIVDSGNPEVISPREGPCDLNSYARSRALLDIGSVTHVARVSAVEYGPALRDSADPRIMVIADSRLSGDEWQIERHDNGQCVAILYSEGV